MREHELAEGNEHEGESEHKVGNEREGESKHEREEERADEDDSIGHDGGAPVKTRGRGGNGLVKAHGHEKERRVFHDKDIRICEAVKAREVDDDSHWREGAKVGDRRIRARGEEMENESDNDSQMSVLALHDRTPEGCDRPGRTTGRRTRVRMALESSSLAGLVARWGGRGNCRR